MGKAVRGRRLHSMCALRKPSQRVRMSRFGRTEPSSSARALPTRKKHQSFATADGQDGLSGHRLAGITESKPLCRENRSTRRDGKKSHIQ
jgi:hypothetical protein